MRRIKNTICLQTVQSSRSAIHSECGLFMTGPYMVILVKRSIKEGPR